MSVLAIMKILLENQFLIQIADAQGGYVQWLDRCPL